MLGKSELMIRPSLRSMLTSTLPMPVSGTAINYDPSIIVGKEGAIKSNQHLASKAEVGTRLDSFKVVRHAEGLPIQ